MLHKAIRSRTPPILVVVNVVLLAGCPRSSPPAPSIQHVPADRSPHRPVDALFGRLDEDGTWLRLRDIKFIPGKTFGWRIHLPCRQPVEFTETMKLPSPGDWTFDPKTLRETTISPDSMIATTHDYAACVEGWIEHSWSIAAKDPTGEWEIQVAIPSYQTQVWHVRFVK